MPPYVVGGDKPWLGAPRRSLYTHVGTCSFVVEGEARTFRPLRTDCGCGQATKCNLQQCWVGHLPFAPSLLYNISALFCTMPFHPTIVACVGTRSYVGKELCPQIWVSFAPMFQLFCCCHFPELSIISHAEM